MIAQVGDTVTVTWHHRDPDPDSNNIPVDPDTVTAVLLDPTGASTPLGVNRYAPGDYSVSPSVTAAGDWEVQWTSTGPTMSDSTGIHVIPLAKVASWAPTIRQVGAYVPSRTRQVEDDNEPTGTFNEKTYPTSDVVTMLIGSGVAYVSGQVGTPLMEPAYPILQAATALWAAYWVELGFPVPGQLTTYAQLREDAVMMTTQARSVNAANGGGTDAPPVPDGEPPVMPAWSFPPPVPSFPEPLWTYPRPWPW